MKQKRRFYHWTPEKIKVTTQIASSLRDNVTITTSTATERQTVGEKTIKMKIEMTIRLQ